MKNKIKYIISFILGILLTTLIIVYADYLYESNNVSFNNSNTTLSSLDVQGAIDELYNKCNNIPEVDENGCPIGYNCTKLGKVTFNANGGTFTGGSTTNTVYYNRTTEDILRISKTSNVDDEGNRLSGTNGYMPQASGGTTNTVTIEGAESLNVTITYQTYSSSYSYVYVRKEDNTNVSGKLYGTTQTTKTYTITGDTVKFYFYNSKSHTSSYSNYLGYYATIEATFVNVEAEEGEYKIPTKQNNSLAGWNTQADGSGTTYQTEEDIKKILTNDSDITLYALLYNPNITCKRASTLHTETCTKPTSGGGTRPCQNAGYSDGDTITYGFTGTNNQTLNVGDAFDCDVNGDGIYDASTERFYYISDLYTSGNQLNGTATFDNTYATLIYYSSVSNGEVSRYNPKAYASNGTNYYGPSTAKPYMQVWRDDLLKSSTRQIYSETGSTIVTHGSSTYTLPEFSYETSKARLLTVAEMYYGCFDSNLYAYNSNDNFDGKCNFIKENTSDVYDNAISGIWLETPKSNLNNQAWYLGNSSGMNTTSVSSESTFGARPVIEIPKTKLDLTLRKYTITFDTNGGSKVSNQYLTPGDTLGTLPSNPTRGGYEFLGWYTEISGGTQITTSTIPSGSITYYAHWEELPKICKRATTLHTETCTNSDTSHYCRGAGYASNSTITYGQLGTSGSVPASGDAFDCDVNGDGTFDAQTERFYYVSTYYDTSTKTFDNDYYVFIYYSNTTSGNDSTDNVTWYYNSNNTSDGPINVSSTLPKTESNSVWFKIWRSDLLKTRTRNILNASGSVIKSNFEYSQIAARLLTMQELLQACPNASNTSGMNNCQYFFEKTKFANSSYATYGPWLETVVNTTTAYAADSSSRNLVGSNTTTSNYYGARPVIEIHKDFVSY